MAEGSAIVSKAAHWALKSGGRGARARRAIAIDELMDAALSVGILRKIYKFFVHTIVDSSRTCCVGSGRGAQQLSGAGVEGCGGC